MKTTKALLCTAVGCAVLLFCQPADAKVGDRIKARRAAKQSTCTKENCAIHSPTGTGQIRANNRGGYEGQLPDEKYDNYTDWVAAKQPGTTEPAPDVPEATEALAVDAALANVASLEAAIAEARENVEQAIAAEKRAAERRALELRQEIDAMTADFQLRISDLTAQLQSLTPTPEE